MAMTCAVFMAMPMANSSTQKRQPTSTSFNPLLVRPSSSKVVTKPTSRFIVHSSFKEKALTATTAAALTASMVIPDVAEAASGVSPSLKNLLLSVVAGGAVLIAIVGVVVGVANFDPVKRG